MGFVSFLLLCRAFLSSRASCHLVCPLFEGAAKLLPLSAPVARELFPSVDANVKPHHVPFAGVFEAEEGVSWSSFAGVAVACRRTFGAFQLRRSESTLLSVAQL